MVPSQNRFRSNDTRQLTQASKSPYVSFDRQPPTLVIVQENPLLPDNLPQDKVLSSQVFDRFLLISVNPARNPDQQELPGLQNELRHDLTHAPFHWPIW